MNKDLQESLRLAALRDPQVHLGEPPRIWPSAVAAAAVAITFLVFMAPERPHQPPPAPPPAAFDGYPLIGPGMTCWFKDIRPEGERVVHDLCERFLDAYRRYKK